jgi:hypothetical protein
MSESCPACATPQVPGTRFCPRCGDARAVTTQLPPDREDHETHARRSDRPSARRRLGFVAAGLMALVGASLVIGPGSGLLGTDEVAAPPADAGVEMPFPGTREVIVDEPVPTAGPPCEGPEGVITCIGSVAAFDLGAEDDLLVAGSGIVVASPDGTVRTLALGSGELRWSTRLAPPLQLYPVVAGILPVGSEGRIRFLTLDEGAEIGGFDAEVVAAMSTGPWLMVHDEDGTVTARSVDGHRGWTRDAARSGQVWLTASGTYLEHGDGVLRSLYGDTGEDRWSVTLPGPVSAVHPVAERTVVVLAEPAAIATVNGRGEVLALVELEGEFLWSGLDRDGARAIVLTTAGPGVSALWLVSITSGDLQSVVPLPGRPGDVDPVVGRSLIALHLVGDRDRAEVHLLDTVEGATRRRFEPERPLTGLMLMGSSTEDDALALMDDTGLVTVRGVEREAERYRIAFGAGSALLKGRPLLVRSPQGVTALEPHPPQPDGGPVPPSSGVRP